MQDAPGADAFILGELGASVGEALDLALVAGTGASGQPLGIINTSGIGTQSGTTFDWNAATGIIGTVGAANGIRRLASAGFVGGTDTEQLLSRRQKFAGGSGPIWDGFEIAGHRAVASNHVRQRH